MAAMPQVTLRFYAELNDSLPVQRRHRHFSFDLQVPTPVGTIMEELGVPESAIDLILVNSTSAGLSHVLRDGDRVSVFPVFETFDISSLVKVRARPLRTTRFLLANGLGGLGQDLRLLGFDARNAGRAPVDDLVATSIREHRILLTRDTDALERTDITHAYRVRASWRRFQAAEVVRRFQLESWTAPLTRCAYCNTTCVRRSAIRVPTVSSRPLSVRCPTCHRPHAAPGQQARVRTLIEIIGHPARTCSSA